MKIRSWLLVVVAAMTMPGVSRAQYDDRPSPSGRLAVGATAGWFRISHDEFERLYSGRSGFSWGVHSSVRVKAPYNLVVKYQRFDRDEQVKVEGSLYDLQWREQWVNVGVRYMGLDREGISTFFSFGFSYFDIRERGGVSIFQGEFSDPRELKTTASGFFIDLGLHYPLAPRLAVVFDFEITSAGVQGKTGLESSSVGGFRFGVGLSGFLF